MSLLSYSFEDYSQHIEQFVPEAKAIKPPHTMALDFRFRESLRASRKYSKKNVKMFHELINFLRITVPPG